MRFALWCVVPGYPMAGEVWLEGGDFASGVVLAPS
ncbi:MAG: hypothetical protein QOI83_1542 [Streptomycetaceae bacterium]|nr:hypothetical protein [Streptomycetaceae bacterium]